MEESFNSIKEEIEATDEIIQNKALYEAVKRGIEQIEHGDVLDASDVTEDDDFGELEQKLTEAAQKGEEAVKDPVITEIRKLLQTLWQKAVQTGMSIGMMSGAILGIKKQIEIMLARGLTVENIAAYVGLSVDEVKSMAELPIEEINQTEVNNMCDHELKPMSEDERKQQEQFYHEKLAVDKASQEACRWEEIKEIIETWKEATDSWKEVANTWEKIADAWENVANKQKKVIDNIVINLFKRELSIDEISGITGLPVQEIETLVRRSDKPPFYC